MLPRARVPEETFSRPSGAWWHPCYWASKATEKQNEEPGAIVYKNKTTVHTGRSVPVQKKKKKNGHWEEKARNGLARERKGSQREQVSPTRLWDMQIKAEFCAYKPLQKEMASRGRVLAMIISHSVCRAIFLRDLCCKHSYNIWQYLLIINRSIRNIRNFINLRGWRSRVRNWQDPWWSIVRSYNIWVTEKKKNLLRTLSN